MHLRHVKNRFLFNYWLLTRCGVSEPDIPEVRLEGAVGSGDGGAVGGDAGHTIAHSRQILIQKSRFLLAKVRVTNTPLSDPFIVFRYV